MNLQHEDSDAMAIDPETPEGDEDTELGTRDGNSNNDEVMENEGMGQYWKLKLKKGTRKVTGCGCDLFGWWLAHSPFVYTAQEEEPGNLRHLTMLQKRFSKDQWKGSPKGVLQIVLVCLTSDILSVLISLFRKSRVAQPCAFSMGNVSTQWTHLSQ